MKNINILHIASFNGNIGDNASHMGFESILNDVIGNFNKKNIEIRKAYNNYTEKDKLVFDFEFADYVNSFDYLVFGGGGFLDYWVEGSVNGTTLNIPYEVLNKINIPILITSIGSNPHRKIPNGNIEKFKTFLNYVKNNKNITIALRNDGSVLSWKKDLGKEYVVGVHQILDHAFFYEPKTQPVKMTDESYACLNITEDQIEMYNENGYVKNAEQYYNKIADLVKFIIDEKKLKIMLVPHIYSDLNAIVKLFECLPDRYKRASIQVAPMLQGDLGCDFIFNIYKNASFVIGSRYHTNVCSLKFGKPSIGLSPLNRIKYLYDFFSIPFNFEFVNSDFHITLRNKINNLDNQPNMLQKLGEEQTKTIDFYRNYFSVQKTPEK